MESLFQAMQKSVLKKGNARQKLAVLDLKRATAVGIRMSRLRYYPQQAMSNRVADCPQSTWFLANASGCDGPHL